MTDKKAPFRRRTKAEKGTDQKHPSSKELRKQWKEEVTRTKWKYDEWYKHPKGTVVRIRPYLSLPK